MNVATLREKISNRQYKYMAFDEAELAELAAALDDRDRLGWLHNMAGAVVLDYRGCEFVLTTADGTFTGMTLRAAIDVARSAK